MEIERPTSGYYRDTAYMTKERVLQLYRSSFSADKTQPRSEEICLLEHVAIITFAKKGYNIS